MALNGIDRAVEVATAPPPALKADWWHEAKFDSEFLLSAAQLPHPPPDKVIPAIAAQTLFSPPQAPELTRGKQFLGFT